ncbi:MAG: hypothetical protein J0I32_05785 [Sphingobacteriales bacterium]|nr:hypothetical protein [Sphingobacteriales bacterium]OJW03920.1 MAG: hypothetical protein BGO52_17375 [Sphingobacteriales bacterium 44-61]
MAKSVSNTVSVKPKKGRKVKTLEDIQEDIKSKCLSIKSIIDSGNLNRLKELEPLVSKAMADELGVNHGRFSDKLRNPVKFSVIEIHRFALYVKADPDKLMKHVNQEILSNSKLMKELSQFRSIKDLKQYNSLKK